MPVVFYINFILTWVYNNSKVYNDLINVKNMRTVLLSHCKQHYVQNITRETCAQREIQSFFWFVFSRIRTVPA